MTKSAVSKLKPKTAKPKASYQHWLNERISPELQHQVNRLRNAKDVQHVRLMADAHLANEVCVGCVLATSQLIYPAAIGGDIGCGMLAIAFDAEADFIGQTQAQQILQHLSKAVPIIKQSQPQQLPFSDSLSCHSLEQQAQRDGRYQLGTLGRGNHFLELQQCSESGQLWLMVHTGSRGMGPAIRDHHLAHADGRSAGIGYLDSKSEQGIAYTRDMHWARKYANANRELILVQCQQMFHQLFGIEAEPDSLIHCDHNHFESLMVKGQSLLVHRKGASNVAKGVLAVIPGSMGSDSFHVAGKGNEDSLYSSSHGAGRCMSRQLARKTIGVDSLAKQLDGVYYQQSNLHLLKEEAPSSYKNIDEVMRLQKKLVKVRRRLHPVLSYKGV